MDLSAENDTIALLVTTGGPATWDSLVIKDVIYRNALCNSNNVLDEKMLNSWKYITEQVESVMMDTSSSIRRNRKSEDLEHDNFIAERSESAM